MDYTFTKECRALKKDNEILMRDRAYESLITFLYRLNLRGKEKARQIDEYDSETLFGNTTLVPGNIYIFLYRAEKPTVYDDGMFSLKFYDSMPILLVTHAEKNCVRGINLNLCNQAVRTGVINTLHNLDLPFFSEQSRRMAEKKAIPVSRNVIWTFTNTEKEKAFIKVAAMECKLRNADILIRNYNIGKIQNVRMVEVWQHKYIPFLTYTGEVKQDVLTAIWKLSGQDFLEL